MKIDRALIIRLSKHEISVNYAEDCANSCEKHNLPYEFIEAIDKNDYKDIHEALKKSVGTKVKNGYGNRLGNICCHASMIKCWKRIVEIGKPCIILEHDALILGDVTTIDIPDMSVVTFGHRVSSKDEYTPPYPAKELIEIPRSIGVHACGLTPNTAKWLYDDAIENGIGVGVDRWLMMNRSSGLPLYVCDPPQAVAYVRESTIRKANKKDLINFPESLTTSWYEGLK